MPIQNTHPGVYVEEVQGAQRAITGVLTGMGCFIGRASQGPDNKPKLCNSYSAFEKIFGSDTTFGDLPRAVWLFFQNGGTQCWVTRIVNQGPDPVNRAVSAAAHILTVDGNTIFVATAVSKGSIGNTVCISVDCSGTHPAESFNLTIFNQITDDSGQALQANTEYFPSLSLNPAEPMYAVDVVNLRSLLIKLESINAESAPLGGRLIQAGMVFTRLEGGSDGAPAEASDYQQAFAAIDHEEDIFNLLVLPKDNTPGALAPQTYYGIASDFCWKRRAFLLMDPPDNWTTVMQATYPVNGIDDLRKALVTDQAAVYYPNLIVTNDDGSTTQVGPAGAIAGLIARTDANQGVWRAPAGPGAILVAMSGLQFHLGDADSSELQAAGINPLRLFPEGILCWGARTTAGDDQTGSQWKYIPVRRMALYIEESLYRGLQWVVFEPNTTSLWTTIKLLVETFMDALFLQGAFQGQTRDRAYFVKCDSDTNTPTDIENGVINIVVGFAPLKPAEFVILNIRQKACER